MFHVGHLVKNKINSSKMSLCRKDLVTKEDNKVSQEKKLRVIVHYFKIPGFLFQDK